VKEGSVAFEFAPREKKSKTPAKEAGQSKEPPPKIDFTGQEPVGKCPVCGSRVFETEAGYLCERSQADKRRCKFKVNKSIAQQPIERVQASKLLAENKTDLLDKFISKA